MYKDFYSSLFVCCFTSKVNSYGHCGTVSSPNHTFSWASLNKRLTSNSCTYFRFTGEYIYLYWRVHTLYIFTGKYIHCICLLVSTYIFTGEYIQCISLLESIYIFTEEYIHCIALLESTYLFTEEYIHCIS